MILICDCGSTKAEWVLLDGIKVEKRFVTDGFNPNFTDNNTMNDIVKQSLTNIVDYHDVSDVYFYGSGCGSAANQVKVKLIFNKFYPLSKAEVYPDTLAACHALFGDKPGIACILGTGSNACVYDGSEITESVASLGFMIGDEGSGCHIGKRIVHDYFLGLMPNDLRTKFEAKYHLDREAFLKKVYQGEQPSRYLAEFAKFAGENIDNQYVVKTVGECFEQFIQSSFRLKRNEMEWNGEILQQRKLTGNEDFSTSLRFARNDVAFVGSVAYCFRDILTKCLANHNIKCEKILKNPMDGLIEFYKDQNAMESLIL